MEKFKNYIDGAWVEPQTGEYFKDISPANIDDVIGEFPLSGQDDVNTAVAAAKEAYKSWKKIPAPKRGEYFNKIGDILVRRKKELARIMTREMGKPTFETEGEVQEGIDTAYYAATEVRRLFGKTAPSELPNKMNVAVRVPIGVVGIVTAFNFPLSVPTWKIYPAIAAGNTVVFKPSKDTPHTAKILAEIMEEAGIPKGVFNVVFGKGPMGDMIVNHPDVAVIGFTGSTETGCHIAEVGGRMNKKVSLEMGGKNCQIIMNDANFDLAIDGALWAAFGTTGQRCTATSRLVIQSGIYDKFINTLAERASKLRVGDGLDPQTEMGPMIHEAALRKAEKYVDIAKKEGARLVCGGKRLTGGKYDKGWFFEPTIFADVTPAMRLFNEEVFAPVLSISKCETLDEAIELQNHSAYGLSASIFTTNINDAFKAAEEIESGLVYVNGPTIGAECHMPFGGPKGTGNGHREGGWTVYDIYTEWKTIYFDYSNRLQRAQIDNH